MSGFSLVLARAYLGRNFCPIKGYGPYACFWGERLAREPDLVYAYTHSPVTLWHF